MSRLARWWWTHLLRWRGWPDPDGALDWLEQRQSVMEPRYDD